MKPVKNLPGRLLGALAGLFVGLLWALFGFWWMLLILLLIAAGYLVGQQLDGEDSVSDFLRRLRPDR